MEKSDPSLIKTIYGRNGIDPRYLFQRVQGLDVKSKYNGLPGRVPSDPSVFYHPYLKAKRHPKYMWMFLGLVMHAQMPGR